MGIILKTVGELIDGNMWNYIEIRVNLKKKV